MELAWISMHGDPTAQLGQEGAGGQNVYVREMALALAARGHRVVVFTRALGGRLQEQEWEGLRVVRIPFGQVGYLDREALALRVPEFVQGILDWCGGRPFDWVHSNYWLSGLAALHLASHWGAKHAHTNHSLAQSKALAGGWVSPARRVAEARILRQADLLLPSSPSEAAMLADMAGPKARSLLLPCGVDLDRFVPKSQAQARLLMALPEGAPVVGYVGRFDPGKGLGTLVEAAGLLTHEPVHWLFAGGSRPGAPDEVQEQALRRAMAALGLADRCHFLGPVGHDQLPWAYAAMDLLVVPSHYESFGMVALEALACGRPVVASAVGGLGDLLNHPGVGLGVPPQDPKALAGGVLRLLRDPEGRRRMGQAGRTLAERQHAWSKLARDLELAYRQGSQLSELRLGHSR